MQPLEKTTAKEEKELDQGKQTSVNSAQNVLDAAEPPRTVLPGATACDHAPPILDKSSLKASESFLFSDPPPQTHTSQNATAGAIPHDCGGEQGERTSRGRSKSAWPPPTSALDTPVSSIGSTSVMERGGARTPSPPTLERRSNHSMPGAFRVLGPTDHPVNPNVDGDGLLLEGALPPELNTQVEYGASSDAREEVRETDLVTSSSLTPSVLSALTSISTAYLVEASLVEQAPPNSPNDDLDTRSHETPLNTVVEATPVGEDARSTPPPPPGSTKRRWYILAALATVVTALAVGVSVGTTYAVSSERPNPAKAAPSNATETLTSPTAAPTSPALPQILEEFRDTLPEYTRTAMAQDDASPQARALQWLASTPLSILSNYTTQRMTQRFAMATLHYATNGEYWLRKDGWLTFEHECKWYSSYYNDPPCAMGSEDLLSILMADNKLNGTLPLELGLLTTLQILNIQTNPFLAGTIPTTLAQLTHLTDLILGYNDLSGTFPQFLTGMTDLVQIDVSRGRFTGPLPPDWSQMTSMVALSFFSNALTGPLPDSFQDLTKLMTLDAGGNRLEGTIPTGFGRLTDLTYMTLDRNALTGPIPPELGYMTDLSFVYLNRNFLTGTIPSELGAIPRLIFIQLSNNDLRGSAPSQLCALVNSTGLKLTVNCDEIQCGCDCECQDDQEADDRFVVDNDSNGEATSGDDTNGDDAA